LTNYFDYFIISKMKAEELLAKEHLTVDDCLKLYDEVGLLGLLDRVKELSRKVGIKEVVDCEDKVGWYDTSCGKRVFCVPEDYRNGKLKEWDIK